MSPGVKRSGQIITEELTINELTEEITLLNRKQIQMEKQLRNTYRSSMYNQLLLLIWTSRPLSPHHLTLLLYVCGKYLTLIFTEAKRSREGKVSTGINLNKF